MRKRRARDGFERSDGDVLRAQRLFGNSGSAPASRSGQGIPQHQLPAQGQRNEAAAASGHEKNFIFFFFSPKGPGPAADGSPQDDQWRTAFVGGLQEHRPAHETRIPADSRHKPNSGRGVLGRCDIFGIGQTRPSYLRRRSGCPDRRHRYYITRRGKSPSQGGATDGAGRKDI